MEEEPHPVEEQQPTTQSPPTTFTTTGGTGSNRRSSGRSRGGSTPKLRDPLDEDSQLAAEMEALAAATHAEEVRHSTSIVSGSQHPSMIGDAPTPAAAAAVSAEDLTAATLETILAQGGVLSMFASSVNAAGGDRSVGDDDDEAGDAFGDDEMEEDDHDVEQHEEVEHISQFGVRDKIYFLFDGVPPKYASMPELRLLSPISFFMVHATMFLVLVSCMSFAVETLPQYWIDPPLPLVVIEWICVMWFTVDLVARVVTVRNRKAFVLAPLNWVDFFSILPFYVTEVAGVDSGSGASILIMVRVLRLVRAVRIMKLSKHSKGLQTVSEAVARSTSALSLLGFLLAISLIIWASVIYTAEQTEARWDETVELWIRPDGTVSPFQSIIHSMWFVIVTITTVGYGDDYPYSPTGKVCAAFLMSTAAFVVAFPTVVLSANFHDVHSVEEADEVDDFLRQFKQGQIGRLEDGDQSGSDGEEDQHQAQLKQVTAVSVTDEKQRRRLIADARMMARNPSSMMSATLSYRLASGAPRRELFIASEDKATYAPLLMLQCQSNEGEMLYGVRAQCRVNVGVRHNFPNGFIASFSLMLHTRQGYNAARAELDRYLMRNARGLLDRMHLEPRKIKTLKVAMRSSHALLHSARVITSKYIDPAGTVPLEVFIPKLDALPVLLRYSISVSFQFIVEYDDGHVVEIDPSNGVHGLSLVEEVSGGKSILAADDTASKKTQQQQQERATEQQSASGDGSLLQVTTGGGAATPTKEADRSVASRSDLVKTPASDSGSDGARSPTLKKTGTKPPKKMNRTGTRHRLLTFIHPEELKDHLEASNSHNNVGEGKPQSIFQSSPSGSPIGSPDRQRKFVEPVIPMVSGDDGLNSDDDDEDEEEVHVQPALGGASSSTAAALVPEPTDAAPVDRQPQPQPQQPHEDQPSSVPMVTPE